MKFKTIGKTALLLSIITTTHLFSQKPSDVKNEDYISLTSKELPGCKLEIFKRDVKKNPVFHYENITSEINDYFGHKTDAKSIRETIGKVVSLYEAITTFDNDTLIHTKNYFDEKGNLVESFYKSKNNIHKTTKVIKNPTTLSSITASYDGEGNIDERNLPYRLSNGRHEKVFANVLNYGTALANETSNLTEFIYTPDITGGRFVGMMSDPSAFLDETSNTRQFTTRKVNDNGKPLKSKYIQNILSITYKNEVKKISDVTKLHDYFNDVIWEK
jgi:hypothetical protein